MHRKASNTTIFMLAILAMILGAVGVYLAFVAIQDEQAPETPTPAPTPRPTPEIEATQAVSETVKIASYTVDKGQISLGECALLSWRVENAQLIQLYRNDRLALAQAEATDSFRDCPQEAGALVYRLQASDPAGASDWMQLRVVVSEPPTITPAATAASASGPITFLSYSAYPERIAVGQCVELSWSIENADSIQLKRDESVVSENLLASGRLQDCPGQEGALIYRLEASNNGGNRSHMELGVVVSAQAVAAPTNAPASPYNPVILKYFYAEPERIHRGSCVVIHWAVGNADRVTLLKDGNVLLDNASLAGSYQDCINQPGLYWYRLEASNSGGYYNYIEFQVLVS
ncbi:MAG: hypothetical protein JXA78_05760 [Anaerolineales bacterium]|nr:hypothetical protein [Anaerolineales bacterium]